MHPASEHIRSTLLPEHFRDMLSEYFQVSTHVGRTDANPIEVERDEGGQKEKLRKVIRKAH